MTAHNESQREWCVLHVYPQACWHGEAYIAGDRVALTALRDAISAALESGSAEVESFASDGEGYDLTIVLVDSAQANDLATAYTDSIAQNDGLHPWEILQARQAAGKEKTE